MQLPNLTGSCQSKTPMLHWGGIAITTTMFWLCVCCNLIAIADSKKSKLDVPVNPLELTTPDPLLPVAQPLNPLERLRLAAALDELNQQAQAKLEAGDTVGAFEIWHRELRLRRAVSSLQEVEALGRVGAIAWSENQKTEVQLITGRLQTIQQAKSQPAADLRLLQSLGTAFEQVREPKWALEVYEQILGAAQQRQDIAVQEATLQTIAELYLSWFDYPQAAVTYKKLLSLATNVNPVSEVRYLQQLAYIYDKANQHRQAVAIKQQLAQVYLNEQQFTQIPAIRLAIASDYESLGQLKEAFDNYQEAYASAWSMQQYYRAGDALRRLVALYRSQEQINEALETSQILLQAEQRASNLYGMINTYDQIGQMYLKGNEHSKALAAFQSGLELANQLDFQQTYFAQQISQVTKLISDRP